MRHPVCVGVVSSYPPSRARSALLGTADASVLVCAVGERGVCYPDEVVGSIVVDDRSDYRRGARLLVEHGADMVVIRYGDGIYGGADGSHVRELAAELRRHGVPVLLDLPDVPTDPGAGWTRTVRALAADASAVLVASPEDRAAVLVGRLARPDRVSVGLPGLTQRDAPHRVAAAEVPEVPAIRTDWLDRALFRVRRPDPDRDARLAVLAARLLGLPAGPLTPTGWSAATAWAGRAVRALGGVLHVAATDDEIGRAVWGLGAIVGGRGVPDRLRHRAAVLRTMLIPGLMSSAPSGSLAGAADVVLGLADDVRPTDPEWVALHLAGARLDAARRDAAAGRGSAWPGFGDRLQPGDIRLAHALLVAGERLEDDAMARRGLESVDWMSRRSGLVPVDGVFVAPVGGAGRSTEAADFAEALATAHRQIGSVRHARMAQRALAWFQGANPAGMPVYDDVAGACRAGIGPDASTAGLDPVATLAHLGATLALAAAGVVRVPAAELSRQDLATVA